MLKAREARALSHSARTAPLGAAPGHLRPALIGVRRGPCRYCQQHDQGQDGAGKLWWKRLMTGDQTIPALEFIANAFCVYIVSRAEMPRVSRVVRRAFLAALASAILASSALEPHPAPAEAVEVVEALSELAGVGCQMMGFSSLAALSMIRSNSAIFLMSATSFSPVSRSPETLGTLAHAFDRLCE